MPVVVGAAAELRNRDRLPVSTFRRIPSLIPTGQHLQTPSPPKVGREGGSPGDEAAEAQTSTWATCHLTECSRGRPDCTRWLLGWAHNQYYVGNVNGKIGIYQGIKDGFGPNGFSKAIQTSTTSVSQLPRIPKTKSTRPFRPETLNPRATSSRLGSASCPVCGSAEDTWLSITYNPPASGGAP